METIDWTAEFNELTEFEDSQWNNITIDAKECLECGACVDGCPMGALALRDGCVNISSECVGCMACIAICPVSAIKAL